MDQPEQDPLIRDVQTQLGTAVIEISRKYKLSPGVVSIVAFEVMAELLRHKAPMEFDEYLDVFRQELPKGPLADGDRLNTYRDALHDTLILTTNA